MNASDARAWLADRYLPLSWASLLATFLIHLVVGGPVEFQVDVAFLALNLMAAYLRRQQSKHFAVIHLLGIFVMILWYSLAPGGIPTRLGMSVIIFASILLLPNIILVSLYGFRAAVVSSMLGALGVLMLSSNPEEIATSLVLVMVSSLVGGLFFHRLITALEASEAALARAALTDQLTGLGNRWALAADYDRSGADTISVWDLDGLKAINDNHGHARGDRYILDFVQALQAARLPSCRIYRVGGDEFVGLHERVEVAEVAERVRGQFSNVSVGWAPIDHQPLEQAMAEADRRLYRNKQSRTGIQIDLTAEGPAEIWSDQQAG